MRVGAYTAAQLGAWTLSRVGESYSLTAEIVQPDAYWLSQEASQVSVEIGRRSWVWSQPRVMVTGTSVTAALSGPPETR